MLDKEQIEQYHREGFLVFEQLIDREKLASYLAVLDELVARGQQMTESHRPHWSLELNADGDPIPGVLHKVQGVCQEEPRILNLARERSLVEVAEALLGPDLDVFGTKFFPKLPRLGTSTRWHQDNFYFGTESDRILSCGIYLQDADRENGCLRVIPGSHKGAIAVHEKDGATHESWAQVDESGAVDLEIPGGTAVFFSANILHGAYDNHSDRSRYATAWHYLPGDVNPTKFKRGEYEDRYSASTLPT